MFVEYLQVEKNASPLTIQSYHSDLETFFSFLEREAIKRIDEIDHHAVRLFLTELHEERLSRRTVSRMISSLRSFFNFLEREEISSLNPFTQITLPKANKPIPNFLYEEELDQLFTIH